MALTPLVNNSGSALHGQTLALTRDLGHQVSVKSFPYLATGNGTTDDTIAIRLAIAQLALFGGGTLVFPAGTYIVEGDAGLANPQLGAILSLTSQNVTIQGERGASIIKVADNANQYTSIIGGLNFSATDLSGLTIRDMVFDHNIDNNNIDDMATINFQHTIRVGIGTNIRIKGCEIKNSSSVNNITINGANIKYVWIENNYFHDNGDDPDHVDHDVSVIYTHAERVLIKNNILVSTGLDDGGATTGIETHGSYTNVEDNIVINYRTGMNITGIYEADTRGVLVSGNVIKGANLGINIWSFTYLSHSTGFGFNGLIVQNNIIELAGVDSWPNKNPAHFLAGIGFNPSGATTLDSNDISILNNTINHPLETIDVDSNTGSHGIGWVSSTDRTLSNLTVRGNRITNFPMAGIRFSCKLVSASIDDNELVNCGSTLDTARAGTLAFRIPLMLAAPHCHGVSISRNRFYDDLAEAVNRPMYFIALTQQVTTAASHVAMLDNVFQSRGSAMTAPFQIDNLGALLQPYFRGPVRGFAATGLGSANQKFALGSQIMDPVDGNSWSIDTDQITWREGLLASGIESGMKRLRSYGQTLVAGDFALGAGWGATAAITAVQGSDTAFFIRVTAGGAGLAVNATITLTFKDGTYPVAPIIVGQLSNVTGDAGGALNAGHLFTTNPTFCTIVLTTLPTAAGAYTFTCMIIARP